MKSSLGRVARGPEWRSEGVTQTHAGMPRIIYIHPYNHESRHVIPVGMIGMMNAYPGCVRGLYADEVTPETVQAAAMVLLDLHWYHALASVGAMAREIRALNPDAAIAIGGYTAGLFANALLDAWDALDFVIAGDGEGPLKALMEWKRGGAFPRRQPGLVHRDFRNAGFCADTTPGEFSAQDYIALDWFPGLESLNRAMQERFRDFEPGRGYDGDVFPQIPVIRGCFTACKNCYGNAAFQSRCGRATPLLRSAQAVARDLDTCDADTGIHAVNLLGDFLTLAPERYAATVLSRKRDLVCYYAFCARVPPTEKQLQQLLQSFKYCFLVFILEFVPGAAFEERVRELVSCLGRNQAHGAAIFYIRGLPARSPLAACFGGNAVLQAHPEWDMPMPGLIEGEEAGAQMARFLGIAEKIALAKALCLLFPDMTQFLDYRYFPHTQTEHPVTGRLLTRIREQFHTQGYVTPDSLRFDLVRTGAARVAGDSAPHVSPVEKWELQFALTGYRLKIHLRAQESAGRYQDLHKLVFKMEIGGGVFDSAATWAVKPLTMAFPDSVRIEEGGVLEIDLREGGASPRARLNGRTVKLSR